MIIRHKNYDQLSISRSVHLYWSTLLLWFCEVLLWLPDRALCVKMLQLSPSNLLRGCHGYWAAGCRGVAIVTWQKMCRGHCSYLIVCQCVETFPVVVDLSGDVLVLENDTSHATLPPLCSEKHTWAKKIILCTDNLDIFLLVSWLFMINCWS